jgi:hypothetical protein
MLGGGGEFALQPVPCREGGGHAQEEHRHQEILKALATL